MLNSDKLASQSFFDEVFIAYLNPFQISMRISWYLNTSLLNVKEFVRHSCNIYDGILMHIQRFQIILAIPNSQSPE